MSGGEIMETLKRLNARGMTILMVTHNPELAAQTARTIKVKDGIIDGSLN